MKNGNGKRGLPFLAPLILLGSVLGMELVLGNRKAVLACLMAGGLYMLLALPLFWIVGKIDPKGEKWDRPESPIGEFLNGDWIQGKGKWPLRFLLQLLPILLLLGFAAWKIFSDGSENLETLLVFLAWALTALGIFGYLIYSNLKTRRRQEWEQTVVENSTPDARKRLEQIESYYQNGLIDKKEAQAMRDKLENKER